MAYLQFRDQRVTLTQADQAVGAFDGAALRVPGDDPTARAVVRIAADGTGLITRGTPEAVVYVNGVQLGPEPSPLLHGDKVEIAGQQLHYGDDAKSGSTQFISAASLAEQVKAASGAPKKPTSATGGRLVSLVDGREYAVPDAGVTFGREIGNEIVVASGEVSRRHAQIVPGDGGYVLTDLSTNGVLINGARVAQKQLLGRGDVIRIGAEEFRFYADKVKEPAAGAPPPAPAVSAAPAPAAATPPTPAPAPPPAPMPAPAAPVATPRPPIVEPDTIPKEITATALPAAAPSAAAPPVAAPPVAAPPAAAPPVAAPPVAALPVAAPPAPSAPAPAPARAPLATLEVINEGPMKGTKYEIHTPLTNVGRGGHNDVAIVDDSVSDSHAKILRKDGQWLVVDQGSTNGTYVGGRRIQGEQQLVGAPDIRFGNIKLTFRPSAETVDTGGSTRAIAAVNVEQARRMSTHQKPAAAATAPVPPPKLDKPIVIPEMELPDKKKGCAAMIAFIIAVGAAGTGMVVFLLSVRS